MGDIYALDHVSINIPREGLGSLNTALISKQDGQQRVYNFFSVLFTDQINKINNEGVHGKFYSVHI